ncbi:hypothetical protein CDD80_6405 [Ophiocordyceps camponoti-rufipedis]|uniref:Uncharacterized protein n=1 Tax=Ophiocordyceps camponoti-rufipedis TaxID=2004952 RepID=A0A2C5ZLE7_9HYPO|nr:hypothetical protein CDD80_6405 [Ophiocordyceps camponoti-rufipedis]
MSSPQPSAAKTTGAAKSGWFFAQHSSPYPQNMSQLPQRPQLTPQFCFSTGTLRGKPNFYSANLHLCEARSCEPLIDFLRLSRSSVDDTVSQNLNALVTPSKKGFDPDSTSRRSTPPTLRTLGRPACQSYYENVLFPAWQARTEVLDYCALVATSPDPNDPEAALREAENQQDRQRVVDERLDPYSARFFPREARTQTLASIIRQERDVEKIVRTQSWNVIQQRCAALREDYDDAVRRWRDGQPSSRSIPKTKHLRLAKSPTQRVRRRASSALERSVDSYDLRRWASDRDPERTPEDSGLRRTGSPDIRSASQSPPSLPTMPQALGPKEAANFRAVIRSYEDKQYKRGLKTADLILKKHPKHGDTMAMKALILNSQGKTDEAFALAKEALKVDMKSHICWHVYGLLYRANKNFEEAIKAYKFALKLEPESPQIQRDLAILQVQMRDYAGYIQSRTAMLQARPQLRQSWTALAIAHHLSGNLAEAENVLTTYEGTLKATPPRHDIEHSEAVMYKNSLMAEQGDYQRALDHLNRAAKHNLDRLAVMEARADYLARLGREDEAAKAYRALLDRNSEHPIYYEKLIAALGISLDNLTARKAVYDEYVRKAPRGDAARRMPLDFLRGKQSRPPLPPLPAAREYLKLMLDKGVPSTFANLKHLYSDSEKKKILRELAEEYLESQTTDSSSKDKGEAAALFYLAQHYNYHLSRDLDKAAEYTERAIGKDAKSVDFHMTKARILKHRGYLQKASEAMDYARTLDLKDRYINSKAAKYQLRNNENERALKTVGLFTRADTAGGPLADLLDMQCVWYLTEDGEAHARQGNVGLALKRFLAVTNIFDVWQEDQFDFHSFSLRKGQVRAYIDMMRWEDHVRDHPFYSRAALNGIGVYLGMADKAAAAANGVNGVEAAGGEDALAAKKAAKKARKEQQRLEREATEKLAKQDPNKGGGGEAKKTDDDPLGLKLAATTDPLGEAMKLLVPLLQACPKSIEAQLAGFDVYMQRNKYVLALRCLKAAVALDADFPGVPERVVSFYAILETTKDLSGKARDALRVEFKTVDEVGGAREYVEAFRRRHPKSPRHALSAVAAKRLLPGLDRASCDKEAAALVDMEGSTSDDAVRLLDTLRGWRSGEAMRLKKAAQAKWPEVTRLA